MDGEKKLVYNENEIFRFKPLNRNQRLEINRRIIGLKPPMQISHKPRPILDRSFFTANEFRSLLWYYLRFSLYGILPKELIAHFTLLSDATYILSKVRVTKNEIIRAGNMLNHFADKFQHFYGVNAVTINIHLLRHYANSVFNTGPLWCHSMFPFESNIGEIKRSFNCNVDVVEQIAFNYSIKAGLCDTTSANYKNTPTILRLKTKNLSLEQEALLETINLKQTGAKYKIGYEMRWKKIVYKSIASTITKSVDNFIQLADGSIGSIEFFIQLDRAYAFVRKYIVIKSYNHLHQIQPSLTERHQIIACDSIRQKLIYLKFIYSNVSFIEIITTEPNHFECN